MSEAWWIDYVEGELPEDKRQEMEMVLRFSPTDRQAVKNLKTMKVIVKSLGDIDMPKNQDYYDNLQSKIMKGVLNATPEKAQEKERPAMEVSKILLRALIRKARKAHALKVKQAQYYFSLGN